MPLSQQKFREVVFQLLYSHDISESEESDMIPFMMGHLMITKKKIREANEKKGLIQKKIKEIDLLIEQSSIEYSLDRIPRIERNILRVGVFELLFCEIPPKVAISEAIRLSRKFATPEAAGFVNAIMDKIYQEKKSELSLGEISNK